MLTEIARRNARPEEKPKKLSDSAGLQLLVKPSGHKSWRLKYRVAGREKQLAADHIRKDPYTKREICR